MPDKGGFSRWIRSHTTKGSRCDVLLWSTSESTPHLFDMNDDQKRTLAGRTRRQLSTLKRTRDMHMNIRIRSTRCASRQDSKRPRGMTLLYFTLRFCSDLIYDWRVRVAFSSTLHSAHAELGARRFVLVAIESGATGRSPADWSAVDRVEGSDVEAVSASGFAWAELPLVSCL